MEEIWKAVPGFLGYEVSNLGRVRSFKRTIMRVMSPSDDGHYWGVSLVRNGKSHRHRIGRLVLLAFVGPRPDGMEMCHNDGDSYNDQLDNLRYDTHSANLQDASGYGVMLGGDHRSKLGQEEIHAIRVKFASGKHSREELAKEYGVSCGPIGRVLTGQRPYKGGSGPIQKLCTRLNDKQAETIRKQRASGKSLVTLAEEYGVSESTISLIARGKRHDKAGGPCVQSWEVICRLEDL